MSDINIFERKQQNGQRRYLLVAETDKGKQHLKSAFISITEVVSVVIDDQKDLEELIQAFQAQELTVEVY